MKSILLISAVAVLLTFLVIIVFNSGKNEELTTLGLEEFDLSYPGVLMEEMPLAESAEVQEKMEDLLDYDSIFYSKYFFVHPCEVFITYWKPGKTSLRGKYGHNPDNCWVSDGGVRTDAISNYKLYKDEIPGGDWRRFELRGRTIEVVYWYFFDGIQVFTNTGTRNPKSFLSDIFDFGLDQKKEHYYIRISTLGSFEDLKRDPLFCGYLQRLFSIVQNG